MRRRLALLSTLALAVGLGAPAAARAQGGGVSPGSATPPPAGSAPAGGSSPTGAGGVSPSTGASAPARPAPAPAPANPSGPYGANSGGARFGARIPFPRPVATLFRVQGRVRAIAMPTVRLRVNESGVSSVSVRIGFVALRGRGRTRSIALGSLPTNRVVTVRWPRGTRLVAGRYRVGLHVRDPRRATLARGAHASGVAVVTVLPAPRRSAPAPAPTQAPAPAPTGSGVFPVQGPHSYGDGFYAPRPGGRQHDGQDILAASGLPVVAPTPGTILHTDYQAAGAGYYIVEHAADGRDFFFAHCQAGSTAVAPGQAVSAGQQLCRVGMTGDATGPHLHFEIWVGGWAVGHPIDPLAQLKAWDG